MGQPGPAQRLLFVEWVRGDCADTSKYCQPYGWSLARLTLPRQDARGSRIALYSAPTARTSARKQGPVTPRRASRAPRFGDAILHPQWFTRTEASASEAAAASPVPQNRVNP